MHSSRAFAAGLGLAALVAVLVAAHPTPQDSTRGGDGTTAVPPKSIRSFFALVQPSAAQTWTTATIAQSVTATNGFIITDILAHEVGNNGTYVEIYENANLLTRLVVGPSTTSGVTWGPSNTNLGTGIPVAPGSRIDARVYTMQASPVAVTVCGYVW